MADHEADDSLHAVRVSPHIAQTLDHDLKHLGDESVVHIKRGLGLDVHGNAGRLGKPLSEASRQQQ